MKRVLNKMKSRLGFTLAETLMVILILMLVGTIATTGITSAARSYQKVVDSANAQLLLSTTISSLRRELAIARAVTTEGNELKTYTNGETGYEVTLSNEKEGITRSWTDTKGEAQRYLLVTEEAATKNMVSSYSGITYENGIFTVTELKITKDGKELASLDEPVLIRSVTGIKATS